MRPHLWKQTKTVEVSNTWKASDVGSRSKEDSYDEFLALDIVSTSEGKILHLVRTQERKVNILKQDGAKDTFP